MQGQGCWIICLYIENEISNLTGLYRTNHNRDMRSSLSELGFQRLDDK